MNDYSQLRAVPALLGMLFSIFGLYQFGAFSTLTIAWFDYTIQTTHVMLGSLAIFAVAFMSSETKSFEHYDEWEQAMIAASPVLIVGYEHISFITDLVNTSTWTQILAFLIVAGGYGVAMR
ncbi:hypothetical protein [Natrinema marinum]|uniref:hypothetical protein n=1 Tax=Natrinema marinum TaxID=2961598 RepID=UPI0020C8A7C2|nr:hypothetical protein [Natrinema marinum]